MPWNFASVADLFSLLPEAWRSLPALVEFGKSKRMIYLTRLLIHERAELEPAKAMLPTQEHIFRAFMKLRPGSIRACCFSTRS